MSRQDCITLFGGPLKAYSTEELENILEKHEIWLKDKTKGTQADLSNADLSGLDLSGVNLKNANLSNSNLGDANLSHANLNCANLIDANLHNANLSETCLHSSNLMDADLSDANLIDAHLTDACLEYTNLINADLTNAKLFNVNLRGAYLEKAKLKGAKLNHSITTGVSGLKIISIDNIDYYNGCIQFIPSLNTVFYGLWQGDLECFLKENLESSKEDKLGTRSIKLAYELFKNYLEECTE